MHFIEKSNAKYIYIFLPDSYNVLFQNLFKNVEIEE